MKTLYLQNDFQIKDNVEMQTLILDYHVEGLCLQIIML